MGGQYESLKGANDVKTMSAYESKEGNRRGMINNLLDHLSEFGNNNLGNADRLQEMSANDFQEGQVGYGSRVFDVATGEEEHVVAGKINGQKITVTYTPNVFNGRISISSSINNGRPSNHGSAESYSQLIPVLKEKFSTVYVDMTHYPDN